MNLPLHNHQKITRLLSTEVPHLFQITLREFDDDVLTIITWDLEKNIEYSMLQTNEFRGIENPERYVCKGLEEKLNYLITPKHFFDF
jgi:hypothetical protein